MLWDLQFLSPFFWYLYTPINLANNNLHNSKHTHVYILFKNMQINIYYFAIKKNLIIFCWDSV